MKQPVNIFVMVHGMIPDRDSCSPFEQYEAFWKQLCAVCPDLPGVITKRVGVQWGHEPPDLNRPVREDEKLTKVQRELGDRISYTAIRDQPGPNNILMSGLVGKDYGIPFFRERIFIAFRENIIMRGFGDVIYYISEDGECRVRQVVYEQILEELDDFQAEKDVRLHLFGHSLGVTLTHDFLYGLFAPDHRPHFVTQNQGTPRARDLYTMWRKKARRGELKLGSLISTASQLPLFVTRKQDLINKFYQDERLKPADIGVVNPEKVQWLLFYDVDDMLAFSTRSLYAPNDAIKEIQVDSGDYPDKAHTGYWTNATVIRETADLILSCCK